MQLEVKNLTTRLLGVFSLLTLLAVPLAASAQPGDGPRLARGNLRFTEDYESAVQRAMREGKPMLVFFTAESCHFCHEMANDAFMRPQIVNLSKRFVCVLVDAEAEPELVESFQVQGFPTIQFVSPRGEAAGRLKGKKSPAELMQAMQRTLGATMQPRGPNGGLSAR